MEKLQRKSAKLFAEDAAAAAGGISQFGSLAEGTPNYSTDPDVIQALDAYKEGWSSAVLGTKSPALEDRNALDYLLSYQQAYIMQRGIPEYLDTETYYQGSFASKADGKLYVSKVDNNTGHDPELDTAETYWMKFPTPQELAAKVSKAGDTMSGRLVIQTSEANPLIVRLGNYDGVTNTDQAVMRIMSGGDITVNGIINSVVSGILLKKSENYQPYFTSENGVYKLLSTKDSSTISHYAMPNYSSGTDYTSALGSTITVPSDGWFFFSQNTGNYAAASVTIYDGADNPLTSLSYRLYNDNNAAIFPMPKGYKVNCTATYGGSLQFFPCFTY